MPFDALDGYMDMIKKRNIEYIEKPLISEDMANDINIKLCQAHKGDIISLKYYKKGFIYHITGPVLKIDSYNRAICISNEVIKLKDIVEIYWLLLEKPSSKWYN